jgi:hypothetical protein
MTRSPGFLTVVVLFQKVPLSVFLHLSHPPHNYHSLFLSPSRLLSHTHTQTCLARDLQAFVAELELIYVYI